MTDDIAATLAPKSDQLDAIDLMGQPPRIFTVTKVDVKQDPNAEQPVSVHLAEFPRVWRPNVSMRRVLAHCWGSKSSAWTGRQVELYCEDDVKFGNDVTGGTRISRLSHIDGPKTVPLLLSKGRSGSWKVTPLPTASPEPTPDDLAAQVAANLADATTEAEVREWGNRAHARNLLDVALAGSTGTLRELVQTRLDALGVKGGEQ